MLKRSKKPFAWILSIMMLLVFIPCLSFAEGDTPIQLYVTDENDSGASEDYLNAEQGVDKAFYTFSLAGEEKTDFEFDNAPECSITLNGTPYSESLIQITFWQDNQFEISVSKDADINEYYQVILSYNGQEYQFGLHVNKVDSDQPVELPDSSDIAICEQEYDDETEKCTYTRIENGQTVNIADCYQSEYYVHYIVDGEFPEGFNYDISWECDNPEVAEFDTEKPSWDPQQRLILKNPGTAKITVTASNDDDEITTFVTLNVTKEFSIWANESGDIYTKLGSKYDVSWADHEDSAYLYLGTPKVHYSEYLNENGDDPEREADYITWESSNEEVLYVTYEGCVCPQKKGDATVTACVNGVAVKSVDIHVSDVAIQYVQQDRVNKDEDWIDWRKGSWEWEQEMMLQAGKTYYIKGTKDVDEPSDSVKMTWTYDDSKVTIDPTPVKVNGTTYCYKLTAKASGDTSIKGKQAYDNYATEKAHIWKATTIDGNIWMVYEGVAVLKGTTKDWSGTIPSKVTISGTAYAVDRISTNNNWYSTKTSVTIPASVTEVEASAFDSWGWGNASCIKEIKVASGNKNYYAYNGVLYSNEIDWDEETDKEVTIKTLYFYPAGKKDTFYAVKEGTQNIFDGAFTSVPKYRDSKLQMEISYLRAMQIPTSVNLDLENDYTFEEFGEWNDEDGIAEYRTFGLYMPKTNTNVTKYAKKYVVPYGSKRFDNTTITVKNGVYTGSAVKPAPVVKSGSTTISKDYYTCKYGGNKKVGTAKVLVRAKGTGLYVGGQVKTFKIVPKKPVIYSITPGKSKLTVKMKTKVSSTGGTTYKIAYKQKGTSKWKTATTTAQSKTISKLKKGKVYYVKVCAYKKISGTTYQGSYSTTKTSKKVK